MSSLATPIAGFLTTIALLLTITTVAANDDDTHTCLFGEMGVSSELPDGIGFRTPAEQVHTGDGTLPLAADNSIGIADVTDRHLSEQPELCRTPNTKNANRYTHAYAAYRHAIAEVAQ